MAIKEYPIENSALKAEYTALMHTPSHARHHPISAAGVVASVMHALEKVHSTPLAHTELIMAPMAPFEEKKLVNELLRWMLSVSPEDRGCAKRLLE